MTAMELAKKMRITERYAHMILSGERTASKRLGKLLEKKTGIPRVSWCWPEDYPNPMIDKLFRKSK